MGLFDALGEFSHRLFQVGRKVRAHCLRIDQEQVERRVPVVKKVDDPHTPTFACTCPAPPNFADCPTVRDKVACLRIPGDEIDEDFMLIITPNVVSLPQEGSASRRQL